jgi:phosphopantetheinyl transferase
MPAPIETDRVEVWRVDLALGTGPLLEFGREHRLLDAADVARTSRVVDRARSRERLAATVALRVLIGAAAGNRWSSVPFVRAAAGKPTLPGCPCQFSLSHVDGLALIALAPSAVGVDVERLRSVAIDGERRARIEAAAVLAGGGRALPGSKDQSSFLQAWVRLEALAKADGRGIGYILTVIGAFGAGRRSAAHAHDAPGDAGFAEIARHFGTHDLALGGDLLAAVACAPRFAASVVQRQLPLNADGLARLLTILPA